MGRNPLSFKRKNSIIVVLTGLLTSAAFIYFFSQSDTRSPLTLKQNDKKKSGAFTSEESIDSQKNQNVVPSVFPDAGRTVLFTLGSEIDLQAFGNHRPLSPQEKQIAETVPTTSVYRRFSLMGMNRTALRNLSQGDVISLPLPGGLECRVAINLVISNPEEPFGIAGNLVSGMQGTFSLVEDPLVGTRGFILPDQDEVAYIISEKDHVFFLDEVPKGAVLCQGMPIAPSQAVPVPSAINPPVPQLESRVGAAGTLYLDFDGEVVTDPRWNGGNTITAQPPSFTTAQSIEKIWKEVSEDFAPFNINVTTVLARYTETPAGRRMRIIVTPTTTAGPGSGGVAYLQSFQWGGTTPCWAFNGASNLDSDRNSHMCAMTISHELGHTFGLKHDGLFPATPDDGVGSTAKEPYYNGHQTSVGMWGPLMGAPFDAPIVQWARNEYRGRHFSNPADLNFYQGNNSEDDVGIIAGPANKVGFVADDFSNNPEASVEIPQSSPGTILLTNGLITNDGDVDFFRISLETGPLLIQASNASTYPDLKIRLSLINPDRMTTNTTASPSNSLVSSITTNLAAGTYFLRVEGVGTTTDTNTTDGFTGYGSVGQYSLRGSFRYLPHPPGDFFAEPIILPSLGSFSSSNSILGADAEPMEKGFITSRPRTTLWFLWTAPGSGMLDLNTAGSGFDTVLAVATGSSLRNLQLVAANNNAGSGITSSALRFRAIQGSTYYFVVDSASGILGNGQLVLNGSGSLQGKPANDNFEQALSLPPHVSFENISSVLSATSQAFEPALVGLRPTRSVWFRWTAPSQGNLVLHTGGSDFANVFGIYSGTNLASLRLLQGRASPAFSTNPITLPVLAGSNYVIKLDGAKSANGLFRLSGQLLSLPAPASLTFTNFSTSNRQVPPRIGWSAVAGASHYQVEIWRNNRLIRGASFISNTTTWANGPAIQRTSGYTARVRAFSNNLASDWAGPVPAVFP